MKNNPSANLLSTSVRIYSNMLAAYPQMFREKYETQMVQVFRDSLKYEYRHNGISGVIGLWLHTFIDLVFTALIERIAERSKKMFSPKVITWGGLAGALCGVMWIIMGIAPSAVAFVLAFILGLGGLAGLYSWQGGQSGRLASTGFAFSMISMVLAIGTLWWGFASGRMGYIDSESDALSSALPLLIILLTIAAIGIGLALIGIANLRAKTQPRWWGLPLGLGILTILQSFSMWLAYYLPMSQGHDPWSQYYDDILWFPSIVWVLAGVCWMALGIMLEREAKVQIATPKASTETR